MVKTGASAFSGDGYVVLGDLVGQITSGVRDRA